MKMKKNIFTAFIIANLAATSFLAPHSAFSFEKKLPKSMEVGEKTSDEKPSEHIVENSADSKVEKTASQPVAQNTIIGTPAPDFSVLDINNVTVSLADLKGKIIVLEWYNHSCNFVRKHYDAKNIQAMQNTATEKDVVWLTIAQNKYANGKDFTIEDAQKIIESEEMKPAYFIIDENKKLTNLFNATKTPEFRIIDRRGNFAYSGAIDNKPTADAKDVKGALNYVKSSINALFNDAKPGRQETTAYGCGI
jgi:peroxiredoxin